MTSKKRKEQKKLLRLRALLTVPLEERTNEYLNEIAKLLKILPFFGQYASSHDFVQIAKYIQLQRFDPKSVVMRQGEPGTTFYIILSGSVSVMINIPSEIKGVTNLREVAQLKAGSSFGEIALHYDSVRTATVVTQERTELIVLEKEPFQMFISAPKNEQLDPITEIFEQIEPLCFMEKKLIVNLATKSTIKKFNTDAVVVKQGTWPNALCFVKLGRLRIVRHVLFKVDITTKELNNDTRDPLPAEVDSGSVRSITLNMDEIGKLDFFCEHAIIHGEQIGYTVISSLPCELILVSVEDFKAIVPPNIIQKLKTKYSKAYPDDETLREKYYTSREWDSMKTGILKDAVYYNMIKERQKVKLLRRYDRLEKSITESMQNQAGNAAKSLAFLGDYIGKQARAPLKPTEAFPSLNLSKVGKKQENETNINSNSAGKVMIRSRSTARSSRANSTDLTALPFIKRNPSVTSTARR